MRIRDWSFRRVLFRSNRAMIEGKRVVLVDDSIVRGTTSLKIVQMIRDAGAREVHIRVASAMIYYLDFYGIDPPDAEKLLADRKRVVKGKSGSVRVEEGGRRIINKKKKKKRNRTN